MAEVNPNVDVAKKGSQEFAQLKTYGDLKKAINLIKLKQKGAQVGDVAVTTVVGLIPGLSQAKTTYDFVKAAFLKPDTKKTNTWIDKLDIDDAMSNIIDDTVENGFLKMIAQTIDSEPNDKSLESDFNMNQQMVDYLKNNYSGRTVTGIRENKMDKLRELIRQAIAEVLDEENATSGGEAYMTKFAFSKGGKNKATKYAEKLGMKVVGDRPKHGKTFDFIKYESLIDKIINEKLYILTPNAFGKINPKVMTIDGSQEATEANIKKSEHKEQQQVVDEMINEASFRTFSKSISEVSPKRKIDNAIRSINKRLKEIDQLAEFTLRLREQHNLTNETQLPNSSKGLEVMTERIAKIYKKIKTLKQ